MTSDIIFEAFFNKKRADLLECKFSLPFDMFDIVIEI